MIEVKPIINYEEFSKIDIRVGTILSAEKIEKSEKLIRFILEGIEEGLDDDDLFAKYKKWK